MTEKKTLNIYLEQLIPNENRQDIWNKVIYAKDFQSLFVEGVTDFQQGMSGALLWRKFLFFNVVGHYEVESYKQNMHLLLKISSENFNSLLLITTEENRNGILLRIDHRSFYGQNKNYFQRIFANRWKKLLKQLVPDTKK